MKMEKRKSFDKERLKAVYGKNIEPDHFYNRDLSWLDFNARVLNEALDSRTPLLERLRFIDIFRSNTDEFFMKRVGSLINKLESSDPKPFVDGIDHDDLYLQIQKKIEDQIYSLDESFALDILPRLEDENLVLLTWKDLSENEQEKLSQFFMQNIFPILTPLAVDVGHPFPFLSNLSKSIAVCAVKPGETKKRFARVKIPTELPAWIDIEKTTVPQKRTDGTRFISIEEVISNNLDELFEGVNILSKMIFRITRSAAVDGEDDDVDDFMEFVEAELKVRKFAPVVRLEHEEEADPWLVGFLTDELEVTPDKVYKTQSFLSYTSFSPLINVALPHLKYPNFEGRTHYAFDPKLLDEESLFDEVSRTDRLLHFPYDSYEKSIEAYLASAIADPKVKAIKITLYRTDSDGSLIDLLIRAAENKKQVACVVELKARFDEERNIKWAIALEEAGVHVTYRHSHYKTHAKMLLIIRQHNKKLKAYLNIGTGNFNSETSSLYTDFSLFTSDQKICSDALSVFNYLTGLSMKRDFKNLLVAPFNMRSKFIEMIAFEAEQASLGKPAAVIAKMNSLEDPETIEALYRASQAGVPITLAVRGFCALKPQIKGLSENIRVFSLVGRLLEHSRLYYFRNAAKRAQGGLFYMGSADWMRRNLDDRIEVITPVFSSSLKNKLWQVLETTLKDNRHLWELMSDGNYVQKTPGKVVFNAQEVFIEQSKRS
jgi:polyphosphate kinase